VTSFIAIEQELPLSEIAGVQNDARRRDKNVISQRYIYIYIYIYVCVYMYIKFNFLGFAF